MIEPWFSAEIYAILPGMIVGLSGGLYGVLAGMLSVSKKFRFFFPILTIIALTICLATVIFGVIASYLGQPHDVLYGFVSTGLIGFFVILAIWYFIKKHKMDEMSNKNSGNL